MTYAIDGRCHNAEPGTFGHECGKPATWVGDPPMRNTPAASRFIEGVRPMTTDLRGADLPEILESYKKWLADPKTGARANLRDADLHGADLRQAYLVGANLGGADLRDAILREAYLVGANLGGADLRDAILREADLGGADLRDAILREADLRGAYLGGADLRGADLRGADLRDADLRRANLYGANLTGATGIVCAGTDRRGYRFVGILHADGWRVAAACHWFTIPEAVTHWTARGNRDALARLAVIQATTPESTL